jgi:FkbM family methyltransferase
MRIPFTTFQVHLGRFVVPLAHLVPARAIVPILQGPARGIFWVAGSGLMNFWLGSYERDKVDAFHRALSSGAVVYDVGANVGIYTVLACRTVGSDGRVFAFEPVPTNLFYLNWHVRLNRFLNCEVVPKAVCSHDGTVSFECGEGPCLGKIVEDGLLQVPGVTIDSFVAEGHPAPQVMKVDVEGAEYEVLLGAQKSLATSKPVLFLATHGTEVHNRCCCLLNDLGYCLDFLTPDEIIARQSN